MVRYVFVYARILTLVSLGSGIINDFIFFIFASKFYINIFCFVQQEKKLF